MEEIPTLPDDPCTRRRVLLSPRVALGLSIALGLACGYLDLLFLVFRRLFIHPEQAFRTGRDFAWSVPVVHVVLLLVPGLALALICRLWPRLISLRVGASLLAALALWSAVVRLPLNAFSALILAVGVGAFAGDAALALARRPRFSQLGLLGLCMPLPLLAISSSGLAAWREHATVASLPAAAPGAQNVILIVWDTVRSYNLSLSRYPRDTTPNLARWARRGVTFNMALAPAPWTFPSHSSMFTGQWPHRNNSQWQFRLDDRKPTLAGFLASHGYQSAAFVANTSSCSYETGLDRGFAHYDDYPRTPLALLARTVPGRWLASRLAGDDNLYEQKWIRYNSRNAACVNGDFLSWLGRRRADRPFFAFLNYFDAHDPYLPPPQLAGRFASAPRSPRDYWFLLNRWLANVDALGETEVLVARDCYDECIAYLDEQLGRLLADLQRQGLLDNTLVIITSDHGEAFGDHRVFGHASGVHLDQVGVPLVMLSPRTPRGRVVLEPVSLRDLPATVVDQLGLAQGAPFEGGSLAAHWESAPSKRARDRAPSPALSEVANATAVRPRAHTGRKRAGFQLSLVDRDGHFIRDGTGVEQLYDIRADRFEEVDLMKSRAGRNRVRGFRKRMLSALRDNPGSSQVEQAYLSAFREWLGELQRDESDDSEEHLPTRDRDRRHEDRGLSSTRN